MKVTKAKKKNKKYGLFYCGVCNKEFHYKVNLMRHEKIHSPEKDIKCPLCPFECKLKHYLVRHMLKHNGIKPYKCGECGKEFTTSHSLTSHTYIHTNEKPYQCSICSYACRDKSTLRKHERRHAGTQMVFQCKMCPKKYKAKGRLKIHVAEEHLDLDMKRHECTICKGLYKTKATLTHHIKTVHDKSSRVQCEICGHEVSHRGNLKAHMMTHVDAKPYRCGFRGCTKRYKDEETAKRHRIIHFPEQQLKCEQCGRRFTRKVRLKRHQLTHQPHTKCVVCDYCGVAFYNKNYLSTHIQRKHGRKGQRYECDICGFVTTNKPSIVMHIKYGHNADDDRECTICHTIYKKHIYLKMHYLKSHNIRYKMKKIKKRKPRKPSIEIETDVEIKEELPDLSDVEEAQLEDISILDIEKEEFIGFPPEPKVDTETVHDMLEIMPEKIAGYPENLCGSQFDNIFADKIEVTYETKAKKKKKNVIRGEQHYARKHVEKLLLKARKTRKAAALEELRLIYNDRIQAASSKKHDKVKITYFEKKNIVTKITDEGDDKIINDLIKDNDRGSDDNVHVENISKTIKRKENIHEIKRVDQIDRETNINENDSIQDVVNSQINEENDEIDTQSKAIDKRDEIRNENDVFDDKEQGGMNEDHFDYNTRAVDQIDREENDSNDSKQQGEAILDKHDVNFDKTVVVKEKINENDDKEQSEAAVDDISDENYDNFDKTVVNEVDSEEKINKHDSNDNKDLSEAVVDHIDDRNNEKLENERVVDQIDGEESDKNDSIEEEQSDNDEEHISDANYKPNGKIQLNSHQCYICFKLFPTKLMLFDHCKEHFDVCNENTLKKCPLCNYVTKLTITTHMQRVHDLKIKLPYSKINDKKNNDNGSRYFYKINSDEIENLEIIPSVKSLNKQAYIEIDKKSRLKKDKAIEKPKLVKKGQEWVVEKDTFEVGKDFLLPRVTETDVSLKLSDSYFDRLKNLSLIAKKRGSKMLYPCENCDKICQTLSALKLHNRKHESNPKPYRKKVWKHKMAKTVKNRKTSKSVNLQKTLRIDQKTGKTVKVNGNRFADPKPIVNKHKCDEELKDFYKNNIKGSDIEFWQFLKIFNKMNRENVNDFQALENRTDFGIHKLNNEEKAEDTIKEKVEETDKKKKGNVLKNVKVKNKFTRRILISKKEHLRRIEIIKQLRHNITKNIN